VRTIGIFCGALALAVTACSLRQITADSTADMLHAASPQFNTLEDLEFAESALPASLVTIESVWRVSPDNRDVLIELVQGYASYGFAFLEDHMEQATADGQDELADHYRARARTAYARGRMFGFRLLNVAAPVDGGPESQMHGGLEAWRRYLRRFGHDDVPALYWTANAWASRIQLSLDDPGSMLDLPLAMALVARARELDPEFYYGGLHAFYGVYYAGMPASVGGQPRLARDEFEAALRATQRHLLIYQVLYARTYAVMAQDRALYRQLLEEVLHADDVMPSERLTNQIAKRRALRYLAQIDELFTPAEDPAAGTGDAQSSHREERRP
jgi:hypothetical protein